MRVTGALLVPKVPHVKSCILNAWRSVVVLVVRVDVASNKSGLTLLGATPVIVISKPGGIGNVMDSVMGNLDSSSIEYAYISSPTSSINHLKFVRSEVMHVICTVVGQMLPFNGAGMVVNEAEGTPKHNTSVGICVHTHHINV